MAWSVYVLRCRDGTYYTGCTSDAQRRLAEHNAGRGARYTRTRTPVELVYQEPQPDRSSAQRRESEIRRLRRPHKEALIQGG